MISHRYFFIAVAFVALLMISNTVVAKIVHLGPFMVGGGIILFPFTYIFADILTEVYGYRGSRPIIWAGLGSIVLMALAYTVVQHLPAAPFWQNQQAYESILGQTPRIVLGSIIAYFVGEFTNSYVLSKMKIWTKGKHLWMRTISSTIVGEGVDSIIIVIIAFAGVFPLANLVSIAVSGFILKVLIEVIMTPVTYRIVAYLKKHEGVDVYDTDETYNPFKLF